MITSWWFIGVFSYVADFLLIISFHNITVKYLNSDGFVRCNSWFLCEWSLPGDSPLLLRVPCAVAESAGKFWPPTCREWENWVSSYCYHFPATSWWVCVCVSVYCWVGPYEDDDSNDRMYLIQQQAAWWSSFSHFAKVFSSLRIHCKSSSAKWLKLTTWCIRLAGQFVT